MTRNESIDIRVLNLLTLQETELEDFSLINSDSLVYIWKKKPHCFNILSPCSQQKGSMRLTCPCLCLDRLWLWNWSVHHVHSGCDGYLPTACHKPRWIRVLSNQSKPGFFFFFCLLPQGLKGDVQKLWKANKSNLSALDLLNRMPSLSVVALKWGTKKCL